MKTFNRYSLITLLLASSLAPTAMAADSAAVAVSANVLGTCKFNSGGTVAFGDLDPSTAIDVAGTVSQPQFWCTKNAAYTISDDFGVNEATAGTAPRRLSNGIDFIPYTFTYRPIGVGTGPATPITMDIAATISAADYANVSAGAYTDTVTLTITP